MLDRSRATLTDIISRQVLPNSIVYTDMWRSYVGLEILDFNIRPRNRTKKINRHLAEFIWRRKHSDDLWGAFLNATSQEAVNLLI